MYNESEIIQLYEQKNNGYNKYVIKSVQNVRAAK